MCWLAVCRKFGVVPKREARLMPAMPRMPSGGKRVAATARRASSAFCTKGNSTVVAPASSTRLTITASFHGTRTTGSMRVLPTACSMCMTPIISSGVCSMSITPQSKPAWPMASATRALADMIHVPSGGWPPAVFSSLRKAFMRPSWSPEVGLQVVRAGNRVEVVRRDLGEAQ